jgi:hypothetical protein
LPYDDDDDDDDDNNNNNNNNNNNARNMFGIDKQQWKLVAIRISKYQSFTRFVYAI